MELLIDGHILVLRGNVLETFTANGHHSAHHVCHVAIEVKPTRRDDVKVRIGVEVGGMILEGIGFRATGAELAALAALVDEAKRRRDVARAAFGGAG
jgi:hypothetical protein